MDIKKNNKVTTLQQLADFINSNTLWRYEAKSIIEQNGWNYIDYDDVICNDANGNYLSFNENGIAFVYDSNDLVYVLRENLYSWQKEVMCEGTEDECLLWLNEHLCNDRCSFNVWDENWYSKDEYESQDRPVHKYYLSMSIHCREKKQRT